MVNAQFLSLIRFCYSPLRPQAKVGAVRARTTALVKRALAAEVRAAQDTQHPMRYHLRKSTPRLTSTKIIFETKDGAVARLIAINDKPLSAEDEQKEQDRLAISC